MADLPAQALAENRPWTQTGNAERIAVRHGDQIRYRRESGDWLYYNCTRWVPGSDAEVIRLAIETVRSIAAEGQDARTFAMKSEDPKALLATVRILRALTNIEISATDLDSDPWLYNTRSGTIDLRDGTIRKHSPNDLITHTVNTEVDFNGPPERFLRFLSEVFPNPDGTPREIGDPLMPWLQRLVGYSLTGDTKEECMVFCYGTGANGKSKFFDLLRWLGGDYVVTIPIEALMRSRGDRPAYEIATLPGKRIALSVETPKGSVWDDAKIKQLSGSENYMARAIYGKPFEFRPSHKLWISGNHQPDLSAQDTGIRRRFILLPFTVKFPINDELPTELRKELPRIAAWAVEGARDYRLNGLGTAPDLVAEATRSYFEEEDLLRAFLAERIDIDPYAGDRDEAASAGEIYAAYQGWARANGQKEISHKRFSKELDERGFAKHRTKDATYRTGFTIRKNDSNGGAWWD